MAERLIGKGCDLRIYDPEVQSVAPAGRQQALHRAEHPAHRQPDGLKRRRGNRPRGHGDRGLGSKPILAELQGRIRPDQYVIDLAGIQVPGEVVNYHGICW